MKLALIAVCVALSGCAQIITLYPRGGGDLAYGKLNDGSRSMEVTLKGVTYTGSYSLGTVTGIGFAGTRVVTTFGSGNQASAVLTSANRAIRCEFSITAAIGGNDVCADADNQFFDIVIKP